MHNRGSNRREPLAILAGKGKTQNSHFFSDQSKSKETNRGPKTATNRKPHPNSANPKRINSQRITSENPRGQTAILLPRKEEARRISRKDK